MTHESCNRPYRYIRCRRPSLRLLQTSCELLVFLQPKGAELRYELLVQWKKILGSPSLRGKLSKKGGGREQRVCPSLDLVRKPIKSRRTNLVKPAYHRRGSQSRSNPGAIRPRRVPYCEPGMARQWDDQSRGDGNHDSSTLPALSKTVRQDP